MRRSWRPSSGDSGKPWAEERFLGPLSVRAIRSAIYCASWVGWELGLQAARGRKMTEKIAQALDQNELEETLRTLGRRFDEFRGRL